VDLNYLTSAAPDSPAARHLVADVHRQLGQWEEAHAIYRDLLEEEPGNFAALVDMGCYYFRRGDAGNAIRYFQMATAANNAHPAGFYNLSQAYSDSYLFDEHKQALARARAADERKLAAWIKNPPPERVIALDGGFERIGEIRDTLRQASGSLVLSQTAFMPLAIPVALLASGLIWRIRRRREEEEEGPEDLPRLLAVFLPGVPSARRGRGGRAFLGILVPTALLLLPFAGRLSHVLPWGLDPGPYLAWSITASGLVTGLAIRWYLLREKSLLVTGGGR
jgi:tetratricopeptide (TPR) repeat protein